MKSLSCIVVDDEMLARKGMRMNIEAVEWLSLEAEFSNAIGAGEYLNTHNVDLLFLDIEMPGLKGLDFLKMLKKDVVVILTTAYPQFALEAFELEVLDYLVKPIAMDRFYRAALRAREVVQMKNGEKTEISELGSDYFYIKADRKYQKLHFHDVLFIKGLKDYVMIFTKERKFMTAMNIKTIFDKLPKNVFSRVSKSHIANVHTIDSIDGNSIQIDKFEIPLGNAYKEDFIKQHVKDKLFKR